MGHESLPGSHGREGRGRRGCNNWSCVLEKNRKKVVEAGVGVGVWVWAWAWGVGVGVSVWFFIFIFIVFFFVIILFTSFFCFQVFFLQEFKKVQKVHKVRFQNFSRATVFSF